VIIFDIPNAKALTTNLCLKPLPRLIEQDLHKVEKTTLPQIINTRLQSIWGASDNYFGLWWRHSSANNPGCLRSWV